ncbi:hypothetical protein [Rhodococcus sp. NPDC057529]|uniref:hypothetical protein n=1 Tax=Rhodococcus sp. NPDC057529 TaxID=3346158 RepID=UPI003671619F
MYATDGRFTGRWDDPDDPDGVWRTLYVGASRLACYLEVLAYARPSAQVIADLDEIVVDDEDAAAFPAVEPGRVPRVGFRSAAIRHGLDDLDGAAIRQRPPAGFDAGNLQGGQHPWRSGRISDHRCRVRLAAR